MRKVVKQYLNHLGFTLIQQVSNATSALKIIKGIFFDIIFTDYDMSPGMNGVELIREIKNSPDSNGEKIVLMTGSGSDIGLRGLEAGADFYLPKPFQFEEVKKIINQIKTA